jgi:hypothetical protein
MSLAAACLVAVFLGLLATLIIQKRNEHRNMFALIGSAIANELREMLLAASPSLDEYVRFTYAAEIRLRRIAFFSAEWKGVLTITVWHRRDIRSLEDIKRTLRLALLKGIKDKDRVEKFAVTLRFKEGMFENETEAA